MPNASELELQMILMDKNGAGRDSKTVAAIFSAQTLK
jgi:hypothetical protein